MHLLCKLRGASALKFKLLLSFEIPDDHVLRLCQMLNPDSISDLSPLVANTGLGSGDEVDVRNNPLSATSRNTHIPTLQGRGVDVRFSSSKPVVEKIEEGVWTPVGGEHIRR